MFRGTKISQKNFDNLIVELSKFFTYNGERSIDKLDYLTNLVMKIVV